AIAMTITGGDQTAIAMSTTGGDQTAIAMTTTGGDQTAIAICTALMRRVHQLWNYSTEMAFVDSSGNIDRHNCQVFVVLTHSPLGTLP
ncbi:hypothetical protein LSAT2_002677, partial [Lamellibrachia satsuma]